MKNLESELGNTLFTCPECKSVFEFITYLDNNKMEIVILLKKDGAEIGKRTYPVIMDK